MNEHWNFSKAFMGEMDAIFMLSYAAGLYVSGLFGDAYPAEQVLIVGLVLTSVIITVFAASVPWFGLSKDWQWYFMLLWCLNGLCQSVGWPTTVKIMTNWFTDTGDNIERVVLPTTSTALIDIREADSTLDDNLVLSHSQRSTQIAIPDRSNSDINTNQENSTNTDNEISLNDQNHTANDTNHKKGGHSGFIFGIWSANASAGNILGSTACSIVSRLNWNTQWMLLVPAFNLAFSGFLVWMFIYEHPSDLGLSLSMIIKNDPIIKQDSKIKKKMSNKKMSATLTNTLVKAEADWDEAFEGNEYSSSLSSDGSEIIDLNDPVPMASQIDENKNDNVDDNVGLLLSSSVQNNRYHLTNENDEQTSEQMMKSNDDDDHKPRTLSFDVMDGDTASMLEEMQEERELKLKKQSKQRMMLSAVKKTDNINNTRESIGLWGAIQVPGVVTYALCYAALKGVNYSMFLWLPFYIENNGKNLHSGAGDTMENVYNATQILGGWVVGWISDDFFLGFRAIPIMICLLSSTVPVFLLRVPSSSQLYLALLCGMAGFLIGGPANIVSSAISADLGTHPSIADSAEALSTVTGFIDGTASFGAASVQLAIALINGWKLIFLILTLLLFISCLLLSKLFLSDLRSWFHTRSNAEGRPLLL